MQLFSAQVLVETAYAAKWCAEATAIPMRSWSAASRNRSEVRPQGTTATLRSLGGSLS